MKGLPAEPQALLIALFIVPSALRNSAGSTNEAGRLGGSG
jgi:hypothetical protein